MKKKCDTNEQIGFVLRPTETGTMIGEVCRKAGISEQTFYRWKKKFAGLGVAEIRRLKQLEEDPRAPLSFLTSLHPLPILSPARGKTFIN